MKKEKKDKYNEFITIDILKEFFEYKDGHLYKIKSTSSYDRSKVGDRAGCITKTGYWTLWLFRKQFSMGRIIFFYHHGYFPKYVDHIDRNPTNNRIENLRASTISENGANRIRHKGSSIYRGVYWHKNKFEVLLYKEGKRYYAGSSRIESEAALLYNKVAVKIHGEFANLNIIGATQYNHYEAMGINNYKSKNLGQAPYNY